MQQLHDTLLDAVWAERRRIASRRRLLAGGTTLAAGAAALAIGGSFAAAQDGTPEAGGDDAAATAPDLELDRDFEDDLDVLNYALTLEHLENAFYRDGVGLFDLGADPFGNSINDYLTTIGAHEAEHVVVLTDTITQLGGTPVEEQAYDFAAAYADPAAFLETAQALENTGVSAYDGAGAAISDPTLLTAAGTIVAVEALHASYLNVINGDEPAPEPFETPLSRAEVLEIAAPFFADAGAAASPAAVGGATDDAAADDADDAAADDDAATADETVVAEEAAAEADAEATVASDAGATDDADANSETTEDEDPGDALATEAAETVDESTGDDDEADADSTPSS